MRTILAAKEGISKVWGFPKPKDVMYRWMKFLLRVKVDEGLLIHNVVTGHLVFMTNEEIESLMTSSEGISELKRELIANHFLVPEDFNEYRSVNQLRRIYKRQETGDAINHYVILPTTFCNAHCFYCYESDYPRVHMTEETGQKVIDYITEHRGSKDVTIQWFGGEPLVGIQRIDQISQGLKERGIPFTSSMISNGYLFDEEIVERSVSLWNLKRIQITIDGTEDVYNRVKSYSGICENPFYRVLRNIDLLINKGIYVNIRLNVDFYNKDDIRVLIDDLGKRYSGKKYISIYPNMLFNGQGYEPVHHSSEEIMDLVRIVNDDTEQLKKFGLGFDRNKIPWLQASQCMADNPHTVEIQPDGSFCRCEHETIGDGYGSFDEGIVNPKKIQEWEETIERSEYCPECEIYPTCYMLKRCMNAEVPCIEEFRKYSVKAHEELLLKAYLKNLEVMGNEDFCNS